MHALYVAAGGGGDAIAAVALATALAPGTPPAVLTYAWDRLILDPVPGPRSTTDFSGLHNVHPNVFQVLPDTTATEPTWSPLPRLAAELPASLFLLDPAPGATGMAEQVDAAAEHLGADEIALVDVGGDVMARGHEAGLRSPLADLLSLAACTRTGRPCRLFVLAPGIDGELGKAAVMNRLIELRATKAARLTVRDFVRVENVFRWHPSEAAGLLAAAASGVRGSVEVRDAGGLVPLVDDTPSVFTVDAHQVVAGSPASALKTTATLDEASKLVADVTGVSEIAYETAKAARMRTAPPHVPSRADLPLIDRWATQAASRGANYLSVRRLAELVGVNSRQGLDAFLRLLRDERPHNYLAPFPLYNVHLYPEPVYLKGSGA